MSNQNIDLGLAVMCCYAHPGESYNREEIAAWCDCTKEAIRNIEAKALRKLRVKLGPILKETDIDNLE
ncbi:MAG: hypothetical protein KGJ13_11370 [Patescibacteria group bacterium]|nr:hypothetical protein [Patescibacteria group bacterium]